jgi:flagellar biosynthetic protein FliR
MAPSADAGMLVFARCAGFVFRAPGFSHPDVPPPVRAGFAFMLSLAFTRAYAATARVPHDGFVVAIAIETLLGAAIGTAASMLYDGAYAGGRALDDYVGIKASVPNANVAAGAGFGRLWSLAFVTGFFVLGGYRVALEAFAHAFESLPPGALASSRDLQTFVLTLPATLARAALFVAGPAIGVAFVLQFSLAIIARLVPRLSTFTLAFPIVFGSVLLATIAALPWALGASGRPWMDLGALHVK